MIDKLLARIVWWILVTCAACCVGCIERNVNLKPIMPRDGTPISLRVDSSEVVPTLLQAIALWDQTGVRFTLDACASGFEVEVRVTEDLPEDKNGRYEWIPHPVIKLHPGVTDHLPTVAHELGHVLNVRHLRDDECGIMSVIDCGREEISADDLAAFAEGP